MIDPEMPNLDTFKDIWGLRRRLQIPSKTTFRYLQGYMGTNTLVDDLFQILRFRYLQGYMGTGALKKRLQLNANLDTFKDIWGPLAIDKIAQGIASFRYLQGYMGTRALTSCHLLSFNI